MAVFRTRGALSASPTSEHNLPACPERCRRVVTPLRTAVEFALVAPALFLFILEIIEVGRGFMVMHLLSNAARQGCLAGIIQGTSTAAIEEQVTDALAAQGVPEADPKTCQWQRDRGL